MRFIINSLKRDFLQFSCTLTGGDLHGILRAQAIKFQVEIIN